MLGAGHVVLSVNGTNISAYANKADLDSVVAELDKTNFASTGVESDPGIPSHTINCGGLWAKALNDVFSPLANTPSLVTAVLTIGLDPDDVTYTWTTTCLVTNFKRTLQAKEQSEWSAVLKLNGAPSMS